MALEETHSTLPCMPLPAPPPPTPLPASFKILSFAPVPRIPAVAQYVAMDKL